MGAAALAHDALHVDLAHVHTSLKAALGEQLAVFGNELMGAENHIGGGFPLVGAGIEITALELGGLHDHQVAAIVVLAPGFKAGGAAADDAGAGGSQFGGRGDRGPQILADLKAQLQILQLPAGKDHLAKGHGLAAEGDGGVLGRSMGEPAEVCQTVIIGEVSLGNHAQNLSLLYNSSTIIQSVVLFNRHTNGSHHFQGAGGFQNGGQGFLSAPDQGALIEEVAAGVAGEAHLRQHQNLHAPLLGGAHHGKGLLGIVVAISQAQLGSAAGNGNKTMLHKYDLPAFKDAKLELLLNFIILPLFFQIDKGCVDTSRPPKTFLFTRKKDSLSAALFAVC